MPSCSLFYSRPAGRSSATSLYQHKEERIGFIALTLILSAYLLTFATQTPYILPPQFRITIHFGVMLCLPYLLCFAFYLHGRLKAGNSPWIALSLFTLLLTLLSLSDSITYAHITVPIFVSLFFLYLLDHITRNTLLILSSSLVTSALLARLLAALVLRYPPFTGNYTAVPINEKIVISINAFTETAFSLWHSDRLILVLLAIAITAHSIIILTAMQYAVKQRPFPSKILFISLFTIAVFALSISAAIGTGVFISAQGLRYLYPLTILPVYSLLPLITLIPLKKHHLSLGLTPFILFAIWQHADTLTTIHKLNAYNDYYPELIACIDEATQAQGAQIGIGGYWDAKYTSILSKQDVQILQVNPDLTPFVWINNPQWYSRFAPQFILFNPDEAQPLDLSIAINRYGYPAEIATCPSRELWFYNRPYDQRFQTDIAQHPYTVNWCQPLAQATIPASLWPTEQSTIQESSIISYDQEGAISSGKLYYHPPGVYLLQLNYEVLDPSINPSHAGDFTIQLTTIDIDAPQNTFLTEALLSENTEQTIEFELKNHTHIAQTVSTQNGHALKLNQFTLTKISTNTCN